MLAPRPGLASPPFDGGLVIYDSKGDQLLAYNESAGVIWRALEAGGVENAAKALLETYGIPPAQALNDTNAIIAHWQEVGLLNGDGGQGTAREAEALSFPFDAGPERRHLYRIGGKCFVTRVSGKAITRHLEPLHAPFAIHEETLNPGEPIYEITILPGDGEEWVLRAEGKERLRSGLPWEITGAALQEMLEIVYDHPPWLGIFHSAALIKDGKAFLLAGRSGSGKSTLTAYL